MSLNLKLARKILGLNSYPMPKSPMKLSEEFMDVELFDSEDLIHQE